MRRREFCYFLAFFWSLALVLCGCGSGTAGSITPDNPPPRVAAPPGSFAFARAGSNNGIGHSRQNARPRRRNGWAQPRTALPRSIEPGIAHMYLMDHQGAPASEQVIGTAADYESVSLSPDRTKVVFSAYASDGYYQLFTSSFDGTGVAQLTSDLEDHWEAQFSPDGSKIVYVQGWGGLGVISSSGGAETSVWTGDFYADHPTLTRAGAIVFECSDYVSDMLCAINQDGSEFVSLTADSPEHYTETVSVSPDGTKLVFSTYVYATETTPASENVYIADFHEVAIRSGGDVLTNITKLTRTAPVSDTSFDPMFVDDRIVFLTWGDTLPEGAAGHLEVYSMNLDGSGLQRLTSNVNDEWFTVQWFYWWN